MSARSTRSALLIILSIWSLFSGCTTPTNSSANAVNPRQSFLWVAKKGEQTLTLVGTMHIGIREGDMDPKIWQRLTAAQKVIIETDINQFTPALAEAYLYQPRGGDFSQQIGPEYWNKFLAILRTAGMTISEVQLKRLSPMAAGTRLLEAQTKEDDSDEADRVSIDQTIFEKARTAGKKVATFETVEEQLRYLKVVFTMDQLKKIIDESGQETEDYKKLKTAFKSGDSEVLNAMLEEFPEDIRIKLLDERNANWLQKLPSLVDPRNTLIAVGAAHFAGKKGLLELLRSAGYTVKPL